MIKQQVTEFHRAFGQPILDTPQVPSEERVRMRLRLIAEEFVELLGASLGKPSPARSLDAWQLWNLLTSGALREYIDTAPVHVDLPEVADALGDLDYVIEGTRLEFGIDGAPIAAEIHRSNMSKLGLDGRPVLREDGKVTKGPSYSPPDIEACLRAQGWRP